MWWRVVTGDELAEELGFALRDHDVRIARGDSVYWVRGVKTVESLRRHLLNTAGGLAEALVWGWWRGYSSSGGGAAALERRGRAGRQHAVGPDGQGEHPLYGGTSERGWPGSTNHGGRSSGSGWRVRLTHSSERDERARCGMSGRAGRDVMASGQSHSAATTLGATVEDS